MKRLHLFAGAVLFAHVVGATQPFEFPTANRALLERNGAERFFVGTPGKTWEAGAYGCVRSEGYQLHEGMDIRCLQRDKRGEPTDVVRSTADGVVMYVNRKPSLSNYGNYVVVQHHIDGLEVFSLYAHLATVREELYPGTRVRAGEKLGIMGRTSNTQTKISKDRAHLHFEIGLRLSDRFSQWRREREPNLRNDHGEWNGQNLIGLDVVQLFRDQARLQSAFSLLRFISSQKELCRVQVKTTQFCFLRRYRALVTENPRAEAEGIAGYELVLNYTGLPFQMTPRSQAELKSNSRFTLISVNEREQAMRPCGKLVTKKAGKWTLTTTCERLLDLITY